METTYITSRTNPLVVSFAKLAEKKERDKTGLSEFSFLLFTTDICIVTAFHYGLFSHLEMLGFSAPVSFGCF